MTDQPPRIHQKIIPFVLLVIGLSGVIWMVFYCHDRDLADNDEFKKNREAPGSRFMGTVTANESVTLQPTISGRITGIFFEDGDPVEKDQLLIKLDGREQEALLKESQAELKEHQLQYKRSHHLFKKQAAAQAEVEEEERLLRVAEARVARIEAKLNGYEIRAPFAGIMGIRKVSLGAVVDVGTQIATLDDISQVKLDLSLPEALIPGLQVGMAVKAISPLYPDRMFQGELSFIHPRVDPAARSAAVRAVLPNPECLLKPGMIVSVEIDRHPASPLTPPEKSRAGKTGN
jgi:membrane fusion protein (multidrug efflux system)